MGHTFHAGVAAPEIQLVDPSAASLIDPEASATLVGEGFGFTEGPVWVPHGGFWIFSDIDEDRLLRYDPASGAVVTQRSDTQHANGNFLRRRPDGERQSLHPTPCQALSERLWAGTAELLTCGHSGRRELYGTVLAGDGGEGEQRVLADSFDGQPLNSPNGEPARGCCPCALLRA